jgi:hypothetical protein
MEQPEDRRYLDLSKTKEAFEAMKQRAFEEERPIERRKLVTAKDKSVPTLVRDGSINPSPKVIDKVLEMHPAKSPLHFVVSVIATMGYSSIAAYDQAVTRAERFHQNRPPQHRIPTHIRQKLILKRLIEMCLAKKFGTKAA